MSILYGLGLLVRGLGRWKNKAYNEFLEVLSTLDPDEKPSEETMNALRRYDFDFSAWPVNFKWSDVPAKYRQRIHVDHKPKKKGLSFILDLPTEFIAFSMAHIIGRHMIYPGSINIMNFLIAMSVRNGRKKMVEIYGALRYKLISSDGNTIDCMFIDRRTSNHPLGKKLTICCEGNVSYFELGMYKTPMRAGYSVLGWNHPGFANSTGVPFPNQE
ncbi:hypothetical protein Pmani_033482 [Petrolisthes manimaculis]|uniref:Phosphatidylserine Lipase ABHD16 N-terminal domain-containing protein n=1 Tax=Petrolisthes manimaculis TaxID=1843537 RepID=A0AAE1NRS3_9EUCA|nr:hypothetical protein Pmani_033482 [Petrolisthes manimaculis]